MRYKELLLEYTFDVTQYGAWIDTDNDKIIYVVDEQNHFDVVTAIANEEDPTWEDRGYRSIYEWAFENNFIRLVFAHMHTDKSEIDIMGKSSVIQAEWPNMIQNLTKVNIVFVDTVIVRSDGEQHRGNSYKFELPADRAKLINFYKK
jgi:hypothetical protein